MALLEGKNRPRCGLSLGNGSSAEFYTSQGRSDQAITAYQRALTSLAEVRQNLLLVDPQVQFSFRDNVEPIYREFVSLLLAAEHNRSATVSRLISGFKARCTDQ